LRVAGILSPLDTFRRAAIALDFREHGMSLTQNQMPGNPGEPIYQEPLVWEDSAPFVRAVINERDYGYFLLDTGSAANLLTADFAKHAAGIEPAAHHFEGLTFGGTGEYATGAAAVIRVGSSLPSAARFEVAGRHVDPDAFAPLTSAGYIGMPWFESRRLFFPAHARHMLFTDRS
jgi:hypothetical protein